MQFLIEGRRRFEGDPAATKLVADQGTAGSRTVDDSWARARYQPIMSDPNSGMIFILKVEESITGAESEFANRRYQNCANRAYYACYQAAVSALMGAGIRPSGSRWGHDTVQAQFVGELINRRKLYPADLRDIFERLFLLRQTADYSVNVVSEIQAARSLRRARTFDAAVRDARGNQSWLRCQTCFPIPG